MAFTYSVSQRGVMGDLGYAIGTYTATGVTSGTIVTGLATVRGVALAPSTIRAGTTIDHTTTAGSIALTGLTTGDSGSFIAWGRL